MASIPGQFMGLAFLMKLPLLAYKRLRCMACNDLDASSCHCYQASSDADFTKGCREPTGFEPGRWTLLRGELMNQTERVYEKTTPIEVGFAREFRPRQRFDTFWIPIIKDDLA